MKRRPRVDDGFWHVYIRGARKLGIFQDNDDRAFFLRLLAAACAVTGCVLHAYALMSNHYHLVLRAGTEALSRCMQVLNYRYSKRYNKKYKQEGHSFDKPFQSCLQRSPYMLFRTVGYVLLNPVAARIVRSPESYRWTSYGSYAGERCDLAADPQPVFDYLGPDVVLAREEFLKYLKSQPSESLIPAAPTHLQLAMQQFRWLRSYAHEHRNSLFRVPPELVAIYWGKLCGIAPKAMARVLKTNAKSISNKLYKFMRQVELDPVLAEQLELP